MIYRFRGLFFSKEFLPTHVFCAVVQPVWIHKLSVKKDKAFITPGLCGFRTCDCIRSVFNPGG